MPSAGETSGAACAKTGLNSGQLPLDLRFPSGLSLEDYLAGNNQAAVSSVTRFMDSQEPLLYLSGATDTGKTHLLAGLCALAESQNKTSIFIPFKDTLALSPDLLEGLDGYDLVCLDDVQLVAGHYKWQEALFRLFNLLREAGGQLLVSADVGPTNLNLELADLKSRLSWGLAYHLEPLGDSDKVQLLISAASRRGMTLPIEIASYILERGPRSVSVLLAFLDRLDRSSIVAGRRLTLPFVREQMLELAD